MFAFKCLVACLLFLSCVPRCSAEPQRPDSREDARQTLIADRALVDMELKKSIQGEDRDAVLAALSEIVKIEQKLFGIADTRFISRDELRKQLATADGNVWSSFFSYHKNLKLAAALFSDGEIKKSLLYAETAVEDANDIFGRDSRESRSARQTLAVFRLFMAKVDPSAIDLNALVASVDEIRQQKPGLPRASNSESKLAAQILVELDKINEAIDVLKPIAEEENRQRDKTRWLATATQLVQLYALNGDAGTAVALANEVEAAIENLGKAGNRYRPSLSVGRAMISRANGDLNAAASEAKRAAENALINYGRNSPYLLAVLVDVESDLLRSEKADYWQTKIEYLKMRASVEPDDAPKAEDQ